MLPPPMTRQSSTPCADDLGDVGGHRVQRLQVDAERLVAHQHLAGHLQQDPAVARLGVGHWALLLSSDESSSRRSVALPPRDGEGAPRRPF